MKNTINEIKTERKRQITKFGVQHRSLIEWCVILGEEVGEANRDALEYHFKGEYPDIYKKTDIELIDGFKKELIQIAAICVAAVEDINQNHY